jgi:Rad3-related DNA helicase
LSKRKDLVPARSNRRPHSPKQRKKRFLLCCEGKGTEPDYFKGLATVLRSSKLVDVVIADHEATDPKQIVEQAKRERASASRRAKRADDDNELYDEVWCVFDRDEHHHFDEAVQQALANELGLAVSNPCFELWIILHFRDQESTISRKAALKLAQKHIPGYNKRVEYSKVQGRARKAIERAEKMESRAVRNGKPTDNPTSGVWRLVVSLCEASMVSPDGI